MDKIITIINLLSSRLKLLLDSEHILYNDWVPENFKEVLKDKAGIYHFYKVEQNEINSLYIGKAGFGNTFEWDLFERLKQHFQISQKSNLISKYATKYDITNIEAKSQLNALETHVQWLPLYGKRNNSDIIALIQNIPIENFEKNIVWIEKFCISVLQPEFTDE